MAGKLAGLAGRALLAASCCRRYETRSDSVTEYCTPLSEQRRQVGGVNQGAGTTGVSR
ncbi:hypothetical protein PR003_g23822 [Phytophthora rubi]|uniref:Uncharacterized protein n=1 Tax=Phytophthora rubi TaxID=129364 RepID=A0A6A3ILN0_9STRA|nr:hypothetical protein PR002_g23128 [Phytophthora rubi]KAE8986095.1 hypothetical protein PR001_g22693 [Phytophthora rubi]KAE9296179.1 hypothetical protein PR003_g23822 [Phytophthora rubi]